MDILRLVVVVAWTLIFQVEGTEHLGKFLTSYVENERKPTMVVFNGICWKKTHFTPSTTAKTAKFTSYPVASQGAAPFGGDVELLFSAFSWTLFQLIPPIRCKITTSTTVKLVHYTTRVKKQRKAEIADVCGSSCRRGIRLQGFKVRVMKELFKAGIRGSASMPKGISYQDHTVLFLADLDCPGAAEVFANATQRSFHRLPYRWLVLSSKPVDGMASLWAPFLTDSDLVVAEPDGAGYKMTELHKTTANGPTILTPRGVFHGVSGVLTDVRPHRELFRRRRNLMGAPMTMANAIQENNSSKEHLLHEDLLELEYDVLSRNGWTYAKLGFLMLNATPRATFSYRFGYLENGQWTGLIKDLVDYKADIGTNIGMNKARLKVVTYIDMMDSSRARFVFRQPALSLTSNIFSLPFSSGVWIATAIFSLVAALAFYLSMKLTERGDDGVMSDAFLLTMGALSQQGVEIQPRNISARIVLGVLFISLMALYAAYSANIVVLLQAPSTSVRNLAQLAKSKLTLAAVDVDYNHFVFKGDTDPIRDEISKRVESDKAPKVYEYYNLTEGVERIRKGLFAFHGLVEPLYRRIEKTFLESEKCDLMEVDYMGFIGLTAPASKQSPYLELMRVVFFRLREVGMKAAVNLRFETSKPACKKSAAMFSSVGVMELRPVLLFMVYGVVASVAVAAMELLVFHA